jgi:uncharacterized membrane protein YvbJ
MKNCQFCDKEVQEDIKFCNHCGKSLVAEPPGEQVDSSVERNGNVVDSESDPAKTASISGVEGESKQEQVKTTTPPKSKVTKPQPKGLKIALIAAAAIIILLIGTYYVGKSSTSVTKLINDFETAIEEKDTDKLADILVVNHKDLELTKESLEAFIQLYDSKPSELTFLLGNLKTQASSDYGALSGMFSVDLIKDGKAFLFFDNYKLSVNPVYIKVATNYKDTDIIVNGEVLATSDTEDFDQDVGPLIPGEYAVEAVLDTGVFHLKEVKKVQAMDPGYAQYVDLYLDGKDVNFDLLTNGYDDLKSIKLFINGKETEYNIAKSDRVGPLLIDGSMNVSFEAELPWGEIRTNDIPIEERWMDFNLGDSDEFKQSIMDVIVQFNNEYLASFTAVDPSVFTTATPQVIESVFDDIAHNIFMEVEYEGMFHGVDFYNESFILKHDYDGLWKVSVDTITYMEEAFFEVGDKPALEKVEEELRYELVYDPQTTEWVVYSIDYPGTMEEDKMERYTESEPVVHTSDWSSITEEDVEKIEQDL